MNALSARWRRFRSDVDAVREAVDAADVRDRQDAVARALNSLYELWEFWRTTSGIESLKDQDGAVRGDVEGELTAALVHARGSKTHGLIEFPGRDLGAYAGGGYAAGYGTVWSWEAHSDPDSPRYRQRDAWYALHVAGRDVDSTFRTAERWLDRQAALAVPPSERRLTP